MQQQRPDDLSLMNVCVGKEHCTQVGNSSCKSLRGNINRVEASSSLLAMTAFKCTSRADHCICGTHNLDPYSLGALALPVKLPLCKEVQAQHLSSQPT
jgi:hypothetical protein